LSDRGGSNGATAAVAVEHDDRLFELLRKSLGLKARDHVRCAARRIDDDELDGVIGIPGLRDGGADSCQSEQ
jgi:hypothetical protein